MTTLDRVATYLPERTIEVSQVLADLGEEERTATYETYFGFHQVRCDPLEPLADQLAKAVRRLNLTDSERASVRHVVHAPTIAFAGTYYQSASKGAAEQVGLSHACCFTVSQHACASPFVAIDLVSTLLAEQEAQENLPPGTLRGVVLAGEKTFTEAARHITNSAVMGEGTAAILVSSTAQRSAGDSDLVVGYHSRTWGEFHKAPFLDGEEQARFEAVYVDGLVEVIDAAVRESGLTLSDIAAIAPHQVSRLSWLRVRRQLDIEVAKIILDSQPGSGHCFGADPFLGLGAAVERGQVSEGEHYVLVAAGLGATIAAMVVRRGQMALLGATA